MPAKKSNTKRFRPRVLVWGFENVDIYSIRPAVERLRIEHHATVTEVHGFTYETFAAQNPRAGIRSESALRISRHTKQPRQYLFFNLLRDKLKSKEMQIVLRLIRTSTKSLIPTIRRCKPAHFLIPEDIDPFRGRLAARLGQSMGLSPTVVLPFFYEWIAVYPLAGPRLAKSWIVPGPNYKKRLLGCGVRPSAITEAPPINPPWSSEQNKPAGKNRRNNYWIAAFQSNHLDMTFLSFLNDAFSIMKHDSCLISAHPNTPPSKLRAYNQSITADNIALTSKPELSDFAALLTVSSTTALAALRSDTPVIFIELEAFFHDLSWIPRKTFNAMSAATPEILAHKMKLLKDPKVRRRYMMRQKHLFFPYLKKTNKPATIINP